MRINAKLGGLKVVDWFPHTLETERIMHMSTRLFEHEWQPESYGKRIRSTAIHNGQSITVAWVCI